MTMTSGPKRCRTSKRRESETSSDSDSFQDDSEVDSRYSVAATKVQRKYNLVEDDEEVQEESEVFIANLPKDITENDLLAVFSQYGKIYKVFLTKEIAGYAFIKYYCKEDANAASTALNQFEIRPNCRISVDPSMENNRIFIGNIPKNFGETDVLHQMRNISSGVSKVILYPSVNDRTRNRGYGFVEFDSHYEASIARHKYKSKPLVWMGHEIKCDWALKEVQVDSITMSRVRITFSLFTLP